MVFIVIVALLILYALWDVNYFLRCVVTLGYGMFFQSKAKITDKTSIYSICTTNDVDIFLRHMNNGRYLRELDFARFHYYARTGIYNEVRKSGGGAVQGASSIRYRRTIPIFTPYKIVTKVRIGEIIGILDTKYSFYITAGLVGREGNLH